MKKTLLSAASSIGIVTAALLFTGCGDSDSSSSSSTAGTQTGQFVKGAWKGISYARSNGVTGTTGVNGTFTYNPGENVTFDFGLGTAKWESGSTTGNSTAPAAVAVTACENPSTGATWTVSDAAKVAAVFGAYGVNETGMGSTSLSTFIAALKAKVATNFNISAQASSSLDTLVSTVGALSGAPATVNTSYAGLEYGNKITEVAATLAAATAPTGYNLNVTNKVILLSNTNTTLSGLTKVTNTTFQDAAMNNYTILGKLTGGVGLLINGNVSAVAKVVAYDLSTLGGLSGKSVSVSVNGANKTYVFGASTYNVTTSGVTTNGTWSLTSDNLGLNLYPSNTTTGGANATVTFEDAPTTEGAIAKIWGVVSTITTSITEVVYSTATKVLAALH